jgi:ABC-2 type transport system permease protein
MIDLALGLTVLITAAARMCESFGMIQILLFIIAMAASILTLYAVLLAFAGLVFWSPEVLFTWLFNGIFQMARYPVGMYPGWLKLVLTWVIPVGIITTIPAQMFTGNIDLWALVGACALAVVLTAGASALFRFGLRRYASASS